MATRDLAVVIVAAGKGERLGAAVPKAFFPIASRTLLSYAAERALAAQGLLQLIVAAPAELLAEARLTVENLAGDSRIQIDVVAGGETRQQSIANALAQLNPDVDAVLVHDAARAFAPTAVFDRVAASVRAERRGVVPVEAVVDTIKRVAGDVVLETVDRTELRAAQTPQGFVAEQLLEGYQNADADHTDDAALMQALGHEVGFIAGDAAGFKITTPADVDRAYALIAGDAASGAGAVRIGIGTDTHRFSEDAEKPLYLGTVVWPGERGLDGHSDGDAISHAIVDAMLSAVGLGDIGSNFGVDRPEFAGANGEVFLRGAVELVGNAGWRVGNISVQLIGNRPKVAPNRERVERILSDLLQAPVSLSATTTDGLGFLGHSEGVAAVATALLIRAEGRLA
jgi:2-C-methyl-D-erythritol 4-phosphate cytidylyltransferase/2-C-methyl-D-erythritol 2,4-cyclodiphosphate synthase